MIKFDTTHKRIPFKDLEIGSFFVDVYGDFCVKLNDLPQNNMVVLSKGVDNMIWQKFSDELVEFIPTENVTIKLP